MNNQEFMGEVEKSYQQSVKVLLEKEKEYATGGNRLIQFYEVANIADTNPIEALVAMAAKHFTSIMNMAKNPGIYSPNQWNEKTTDLRNYTFLLDALLEDMDSSVWADG